LLFAVIYITIAWQSTKPADKTDSMSSVQSTESAELETDEHIEYGGDIELDSADQQFCIIIIFVNYLASKIHVKFRTLVSKKNK